MEDFALSPIYNEAYLNVSRIGNLVIGVDMPPIIVINLQSRVDRRDYIIRELTKHNLPFCFYTAELQPNPVRGCLESHINIIKWASQQTYDRVCIFEDDVVIHDTLANVPVIPSDANMLYLGGLCTFMIAMSDMWVQGHIYCNHAYIIHRNVYDIIITQGWMYEEELDRFYTRVIHTCKPAYMTKFQYVTQHDGWSDIDRKNKWKGYHWPQPGDTFTIP